MKKMFFSEVFGVNKKIIEEEGYVDISLLCDLPLFVDPFLIFGSKKKEYQILNEEINKYLIFLKNKAIKYNMDKGLLKSWFTFSEVSNNWLGYCKFGNKGAGLGPKFAISLYKNLKNKLSDFGNGKIIEIEHIEKLCLIDENIGSDNISDFVVNIIKQYFLEKTEKFAKTYLKEEQCRFCNVNKAYFDYDMEKWMPRKYYLPVYNDEYIVLTPIDMLTKDTSWLNTKDMVERLPLIIEKIPNEQLKFDINNYLSRLYKDNMSAEKIKRNRLNAIKEFPVIVDYYLLDREKTVDEAMSRSIEKSLFVDETILNAVNKLITLLEKTNFYDCRDDSYKEAKKRVDYLKHCIEDNDVYKLFYDSKGTPIKKEEDLQLMFRLACYGVESDVNRECNNGRGPVDYKMSQSNHDKSLIEFKLASNTKLKQNLANQVEIYEKANDTTKSIKVIIYFDDKEKTRVEKILKELKLEKKENIVLIDARNNKKSASNVK